ncbi:MAG: radical SAM protein [Synergistaceae bacterium]|nr:radical SAM protein [Synergistaceae bacterium]
MSLALFVQKVRVLKNLLTRRPILVIFDVTKLCNQRCPMCNIWKTVSNDMTLDEIERRAVQLQEFGAGYVFLQGGDPLIRKDIINIADIFLRHGIRPTIITNGILLTPELAEKIASRPCNLAISIDSLITERYAVLRGVDSLNRVIQNIESIKHIKHKGNWSITTTVTKMTELSDVINIMNFAYERGFMFAVRPYITVSGTAGRKDETLTYQDTNERDNVLKIFNFMLEKSRKENYLASLIYEEHIKYINGERMPECDGCKYSFLMKETGKLAPCIEFPNLAIDLYSFRECQRKYKDILSKCNKETPCFYNDAREIGFLWRKKWRAAANIFRIISQMKQYGNFF